MYKDTPFRVMRVTMMLRQSSRAGERAESKQLALSGVIQMAFRPGLDRLPTQRLLCTSSPTSVTSITYWGRCPRYKRIAMRLLIATDGSSNSHVVQDEVIARPWPLGTEVLVLRCLHSAAYTLPASAVAQTWKSAREEL